MAESRSDAIESRLDAIPGWARWGLVALLGLTVLASAWQPGDPIALIIDWVDRAQDGALFGSIVKQGYGSQIDLIHLLRESGLLPGFLEEALEALGASATVVSLCMLGGLGAWVAWNRRVDLWILLGMSAIVARLWTYHHLYDDILLVLPTIALLRLAQQHREEAPEESSPFARVACYGALAAALFVAVVPSTVIDANTRLDAVFVAVQTSVWLAMGLVLAWEAARARGAIQRAETLAG